MLENLGSNDQVTYTAVKKDINIWNKSRITLLQCFPMSWQIPLKSHAGLVSIFEQNLDSFKSEREMDLHCC